MRGITLLVGLSLAVGLFVTSAAGATVSIDDTVDRVDEQVSSEQKTLELLLPGPVGSSPSSAFDAALPGDDAPLSPDLSLLDSASSVPQVSTATGVAISEPAAHDASPRTLEAGPAVGEIAPAETADGPQLPDYVTGDAEADSQDDSDNVATQSQGHSSADASSSISEAWNNLDDGEKAAATAGALGLLLLGPLTLYSRIQRDDALENDTRREVYELVENNPGVCIQEVADEADVSYSTASYHLKRLVRMDYVTRREDGNKVLYYKNGGTFTADERDLIPILQNEEAMRVFQHIVENPWCYRAQVAEALGVSHTTVNWHLDRLQDADLVEEHREGRSCHLNVNEEALDRVASTIEKLDDEAAQPVQQTKQAAPA